MKVFKRHCAGVPTCPCSVVVVEGLGKNTWTDVAERSAPHGDAGAAVSPLAPGVLSAHTPPRSRATPGSPPRSQAARAVGCVLTEGSILPTHSPGGEPGENPAARPPDALGALSSFVRRRDVWVMPRHRGC